MFHLKDAGKEVPGVGDNGEGVGLGVVVLIELGHLGECAQHGLGQRAQLDAGGVHDGERLVHSDAFGQGCFVHHLVGDVLEGVRRGSTRGLEGVQKGVQWAGAPT